MMGVLLLSFGLRLSYLDKHDFDYDEGHWLMFGLLAAKGYTPYTEIFVGIPPLALLTIQWGAALFGDALLVRWPMMLYSLVGVAALYALVKRQIGPLAGLLAASFLSFNLAYFEGSATIMAEVPAVALALVSVALADVYRTQRSYGWLVLSGIAYAASLSLKVFVVFVPIIILIQLVRVAANSVSMSGAGQRRDFVLYLIKIGAAWTTGGLILPVLFLWRYDPTAMVQQVIQFRVLLREVKVAEGFGLASNFIILTTEFLTAYSLLTIGALLGLFLIGQQRLLAKTWLWPVWLGLALIVLMAQVPLRPRYAVMLAPALAALSGIAVDRLLARLTRPFSRRRSAWTALPLLALVALIVLIDPAKALTAPAGGRFINEQAGQATSAASAARLSALNFARRITTPHDCIVTDDQRFALLLDRLVPPPLSETSTARLEVGWLTTEQVIEAAVAYHCPVLFANISDRFEEFLPDLRAAAAAQFALQLTFAKDTGSRKIELFVMPLANIPPPPHLINQSLGDQVNLSGVEVTTAPWRPGQDIALTTFWQAQQPVPEDYKIFVHLKDTSGQTAATFDHFPFETRPEDLVVAANPHPKFREGHQPASFANYPQTGLLPTRLWPVGQTIKETFIAQLPPILTAGDYTLTVGLYHPATGQRLSVPGTTDNEIVIGSIEVQN